ncbi:AraC family transcriptional regulator [Paenibacillus lemnae]|uniref:AraC family transcriptional regulator n=1 Tax=Paenibacillus lemnae TaxID=1330551 RepID=A0A848M979_PAELE|nr:AraC family transcriptional regulator [Paenibacillus lemnae]NMO96443.1 AraC family transcriptional regulator [Paenibacillus lemnae]
MSMNEGSRIAAFKKANAVLNRTLHTIRQPEISLNIHYWGFMPRHFDNTEHKHSFFEACYVLHGSGSYIEENQEYPLNTGTLFLSRPGLPHQIKSRDGLALCYVAFEPAQPDEPVELGGAEKHERQEAQEAQDYLSAFGKLARVGIPVIPDGTLYPSSHIWQALLSMFDLQKPAAAYPPLTLQNTALSLILSLLAAHGPHCSPSAEDSEGMDEGAFIIHQAELFIQDNLSEPLSLERVAHHLHITSRHLTRSFRKYRHQSFVHYVQEQRVQKAMSLLLTTDRQIKEISALCGFESVHYFTRVFTVKLGVSPARFRRSQFTEGRFDSTFNPSDTMS